MANVGIPPDNSGDDALIDRRWLGGLAGGQNARYITVAAHAGGGQQNATKLLPGYQLYQISPVLNANDSVALPAAKAPFFFTITNTGINNAVIFALPGTTDTINGHPGTGGMTITPNSTFICVCTQNGQWAIPSGSGGAPNSLVVNSTLITGGGANQLLYDNGGTLEEAVVGTGLNLSGGNLTLQSIANNSTGITGGTANQLLYDNGGTLEEASVGAGLSLNSGTLAATGTGFPTVPTMAALRAYLGPTAPADGTIVYLEGFNSPGDGGQGFFIWNGSDSLADDGGTIIDPNWNLNPQPGPNLVTNGNFASGSSGWTTTAGSPTFAGNQVTDANTTEFWQIGQSIAGLSIGSSYSFSYLYTMGAAVGQFGPFIGTQLGPPPVDTNQHQSLTPFTRTGVLVAKGTTETLEFGCTGGPITITNIVLQEAAGGRWVRQVTPPGIALPEWFGALGNDTGDDSSAIQSAINYVEAFWSGSTPPFGLRGRVNLSPGRIYKCNAALTLNVCTAQIDGQGGAALDFRGFTAGPCLTLFGSSVASAGIANLVPKTLQGVEMYGSSSHVNDGVVFDGTQGSDSIKYVYISHCTIHDFANCINWTTSNAFILTVEDCSLFNGVVGILENGGGNSGENMVIRRTQFTGFHVNLSLAVSNADIYVTECSLDYSSAFFNVAVDTIRFNNCHFETNTFDATRSGQVAPMVIGGGTCSIENCYNVWTANGVPPPTQVSCAGTVRFTNNFWSFGYGANGVTQNMTIVPGGSALTFFDSNHVAVTNNNLTVTVTNPVVGVSAGTTSMALPATAVGKWFFNATIGAGGLDTVGAGGIGVVQNRPGLTDVQGFADTGVVLGSDGIYTAGTKVKSFTTTFAPSMVVWLCFDMGNQLAWASHDGGTTWNGGAGTPDAGTGGATMAAAFTNLASRPSLPQTFNPEMTSNVLNNAVTFNFSPSAPTGASTYAPWNNIFTLGTNGTCFVERSINSFGSPPFGGIDIGNAANADPTFENSTLGTGFADPWFIDKDTATITSRTTGTNIAITVGNTKPFTGTQELNAVKAGAAATAASFAICIPAQQLSDYSILYEYAASGSLGTVSSNVFWAQLGYYTTAGTPVFFSELIAGGHTLTPTTSYQLRNDTTAGIPAPSWATHLVLEFDLTAMSAGTFYLDNVQLYQF